MTVFRRNGTRVTKAAFPSVAVPIIDPIVEVTENVYEAKDLGNMPSGKEQDRRLKFRAFQRVRQSEIDALFPAPAVTALSPVTGPAAGGTVVTGTGINLQGVTAVTVGGVAATAVTSVSNTEFRFTTPAGTLGAKDVVVTDDAGTVTLTGGYSYV